MSLSSSPTRSTQNLAPSTSKSPDVRERKPIPLDSKLENRLTMKDLERMRSSFMVEGDGYDNRLSLTKEQFCEALALLLKKGSRDEYAELFDKIDGTRDGTVDWDMLASHMLLEFYAKEDRVKSTQVPQWKDITLLPSSHKETVQGVSFLKNINRYVSISKEGCVCLWGTDLKPQQSLKTGTETCKIRDLWVTHFVPLQNLNKIALTFTSKEIAIYDFSSKLELNCQYKVQGLNFMPLCLDYWSNPNDVNDAILVWGDVGGFINILFFNSANIALFERPPASAGEKQEPCLNVQLKDVLSGKYKNATFNKYQAHTDNSKGEWVRQVTYSQYLECFISCSTTTSTAVVIGWMEKHQNTNLTKGKQLLKKEIQRKSEFNVSHGVNTFDYNANLNLIATAGVNNHVCLWNPYVVFKPNGVLRGHMASVVQVQFIPSRSQLVSFSKDKVLRIWDVQLQVCIQRLAGMFPKCSEVTSTLYFDDGRDRSGLERNRLFLTFNYLLTAMDMKTEVKDRVTSHEKPVVAALYNSVYNQVVSVCQAGTITMWLADTGQRVKQFNNMHGNTEVTCLAQDPSETRLYIGSADGTVKVWDFNGHCYHSLECSGGQPADVAQILVTKISVIVVGWAKYIAIFRNSDFREFHVQPSDWKGGQEHGEDILCCTFSGPNTLATGSYDGEIVVWNTNSEHASRHYTERSRRRLRSRGKSFVLPAAVVREPSMPVSEKSILGLASVKLPDIRKLEDDRVRFSRSKTGSRGQRSVARTAQSQASTDDQGELSCAVSRLIFLENRRGSACGGAELVSCGVGGWVRFWSSSQHALIAEFVAHQNAVSVIMTSDPDNHYLVTADVDGLVKVWDIQEYGLTPLGDLVTSPPPLRCRFQAHQDQINCIEMCERNERLLIVTASSDHSVALWDVHGNRIGVFGQEEHWKIEPFQPSEVTEEEQIDGGDVVDDRLTPAMAVNDDSPWSPDEDAVTEPSTYRINTWERTVLGKDYQDLRVQKRERRQPGTIPDLPYLHWERTGAPPAGPYSALDTQELRDVQPLTKPDAEKYFNERPGSSDSSNRKLPALADTLATAFDEKSLFPSYILEFEKKMKNYHTAAMASQNQPKFKDSRASVQSLGGVQLGPSGGAKILTSPRKSLLGGKIQLSSKVRHIGTRKSSIATTVAD